MPEKQIAHTFITHDEFAALQKLDLNRLNQSQRSIIKQLLARFMALNVGGLELNIKFDGELRLG